jgi:hypothetical protein
MKKSRRVTYDGLTVKTDILIKEMAKRINLDRIEWRRRYTWLTSISVLSIHNRPQNFMTYGYCC